MFSITYWHIASFCRYCQCFNAARICNDLCRCTSCSNTDSNQSGRSEAVKIILDRNPAAFDSKFLSVSFFSIALFILFKAKAVFLYNVQHDPRAQAAAHKSGCKCRKSMCLKKYCECFEASVPCGSTCICVECGNTEIDRQRLAMKSSSSVLVVPSKAPRYAGTAFLILFKSSSSYSKFIAYHNTSNNFLGLTVQVTPSVHPIRILCRLVHK